MKQMEVGKSFSFVVVAAWMLLAIASTATAEAPRRALAQATTTSPATTPCTAEVEYRTRFHVVVKPADADLGYLSDTLITAATGLSVENIELSLSNKTERGDNGGNGRGGGRGHGGGGAGRGRGLLDAVDECSEEDGDTAVRVQLKVKSTNEADLLALQEYVQGGVFESEIVAGAACFADAKLKRGGLKIREVDPCVAAGDDDDDDDGHRHHQHQNGRRRDDDSDDDHDDDHDDESED